MLSPLVDGEILPFGYGICYYDPYMDEFLICPVPLHWLVRAVRRAWEWATRYQLSRWEREQKAAIERGLSAVLVTEGERNGHCVDCRGGVVDFGAGGD